MTDTRRPISKPSGGKDRKEGGTRADTDKPVRRSSLPGGASERSSAAKPAGDSRPSGTSSASEKSTDRRVQFSRDAGKGRSDDTRRPEKTGKDKKKETPVRFTRASEKSPAEPRKKASDDSGTSSATAAGARPDKAQADKAQAVTARTSQKVPDESAQRSPGAPHRSESNTDKTRPAQNSPTPPTGKSAASRSNEPDRSGSAPQGQEQSSTVKTPLGRIGNKSGLNEVLQAAAKAIKEDGDSPQNEAKQPPRGPDTVPPGDVDYEPPLLRALSITSGLLGNQVSVDSLRAVLPQERGPLNPASCVRAAVIAGMNARVASRPEIEKISTMVMPCILLLRNSNACVLLGVTPAKGEETAKAEVILPESPDAPEIVELEKLKEEYTGQTIFLKAKGRLDKRVGHLKLLETKRWFWGTILHFMPIYWHVILASLMVNLLAIASPLFVMNVYDRVVPNSAFDTLWVLAAGVAIAYFFDFLLKNLRGYFVDVAGKNADTIIASKLMQQLMTLRMDNMPSSTGSLANNLREFESLREFFSSSTMLGLVDLPFLFLFIAIIHFIGGPLAIVPAIAVPVVILIGVFLQYPFQRYIESGFKENTQKNALLVEAISGLETIKTNLAEGQIMQRWEKVIGLNARSSSKSKALANFSLSLSMVAAQLVSVGIIIGGVYLISEGELTMGGLIACNILVGRAMAPLSTVAAMLTRLQQSRMALKTLDLLMKIPNEREMKKDFVTPASIEPSITFETISFSYPEQERLALENVSFHIAPGERVGLIGAIGSGKSTIGRLTLGLYQPQEGAVKLGNIDIRQMDIADLRKKVGYVSQDNYLFYGSVKDNISFGAPFVDDATIYRAAELAGVTEFVQRHPAGFGMQVGERGMALSGGQRQSVAVARALLLDPEILILDEPTSFMDTASEARFLKRLKEVSMGKTMILITHRMSLLRTVDRLIVMDNGRVVADGPRDLVLSQLQNRQITGGPQKGFAPQPSRG